jgi:hypothetical protein
MAILLRRGIIPPPTVVGGTVLFDVSGHSSNSGGGVTSFVIAFGSWSVGSGSNGTTNIVMVAALLLGGAAAGTSSGVSGFWDSAGANQSMFSIGHIGNGNAGDVYLFGLVNPVLGNKLFNFTWTGGNQAKIAAATFVAASQVGGTTTFHDVTSNTGNSTLPSTGTIPSLAGEVVFGGHTSGGAGFNVGGASGTDIVHDNTMNLSDVASNWDSGANNTLSYAAASGVWASIGVAVKAA